MMRKNKMRWFAAFANKKNILSIQNECKKYNIEIFKPIFISKNNAKRELLSNMLFVKCNSIENLCHIQKLSKKINIVGNPFPESIPASQIRKLKRLSKLNIPFSLIHQPTDTLHKFININPNLTKPVAFKINLLGKIIYFIPE